MVHQIKHPQQENLLVSFKTACKTQQKHRLQEEWIKKTRKKQKTPKQELDSVSAHHKMRLNTVQARKRHYFSKFTGDQFIIICASNLQIIYSFKRKENLKFCSSYACNISGSKDAPVGWECVGKRHLHSKFIWITRKITTAAKPHHPQVAGRKITEPS